MDDGAWIAWCRTAIPKGATAVDIGANQGHYTEALVEAVGPAGTVIAIEPDDRHVIALTRTGAKVLCVAMADTNGDHVLHGDGRDSAQHTLYADACDRQHEHVTRMVPVRTIDALITEWVVPPVVDFVKVDTQGAEDAILSAAAGWLRRPLTAWLLEVWPAGLVAAGSSVAQLRGRVDALGSEPWHLLDGRATRWSWDGLEEACARCGWRQAVNVLFAVPGRSWVG